MLILPTQTVDLLAHLGTSLVERALIDAFCREHQTSFASALRTNQLGIDLGSIHPELEGTSPSDWLPAEPATSIVARHTIGLGDPLFAEDIQIKSCRTSVSVQPITVETGRGVLGQAFPLPIQSGQQNAI